MIEDIISNIKYLIKSNALEQIVKNGNVDKFCVCHKNNEFFKKRSAYDHVERLKEWFKECYTNQYSEVNKNNKYGFIKMLLYKESLKVTSIVNKFFINGLSSNDEVFLMETDSYPSHCKRISDMKKKNEELMKKGEDINLKCHKVCHNSLEGQWNFEEMFESLKTNGTQCGKKRTIYCFVVLENGYIKCISDFFSLISFKQFCKRNGNSLLEVNYNNLKKGEENDFYYYLNTIFDGEYVKNRKYQKYNSDFLYMINFYNVKPNACPVDTSESKKKFVKEVREYLETCCSKNETNSDNSDSPTLSNLENTPQMIEMDSPIPSTDSLVSSPTFNGYNIESTAQMLDALSTSVTTSPTLYDITSTELMPQTIEKNSISPMNEVSMETDLNMNSVNMENVIDVNYYNSLPEVHPVGKVYFGEYQIGKLIIAEGDEKIYIFKNDDYLAGIYDRDVTISLSSTDIITVFKCIDEMKSERIFLYEGLVIIGEIIKTNEEIKFNLYSVNNSLAKNLLTMEEIYMMENYLQSLLLEYGIQEQRVMSNAVENEQSITLSNMNNIQLSNTIPIFE